MPKPTTHTDVLVPRPSTEDPPDDIHDVGPTRARIVLTSARGDGEITKEAVSVDVAEGRKVAGSTEIGQALPQGPLKVVARIGGSADVSLEFRGTPQESVDSGVPHADTFEWKHPHYLKRLVIEIGGTLGDDALRTNKVRHGDAADQITLSTPGGLTVATATVSFD